MNDSRFKRATSLMLPTHLRPTCFVVATLLLATPVLAQEKTKDSAAILEVGGAGEWSATSAGYGPSLAVETTPIEHWLEIEAGVAPLFSKGQTEWDFDLLAKKPFVLSRKLEFMIGIGPSWSHVVSHGRTNDAYGAVAALDFMFWPTKSRKVGWYVEPSYGRSFAAGHEHSLSLSAGLLIPVG